MQYTYIIVENNPGFIDILTNELNKFPEYKNIGVAQTVNQGVAMIIKHKPHLIFLDIELGEYTGFDLVAAIRAHFHTIPHIIVTSDYDKYAKRAMNNGLLYFLDKLMDEDDLTIALSVFERRFAEQNPILSLKDHKGNWSIHFSDIFYLQANGSSVEIYTIQGKPLVFSKSLRDLEPVLPNCFLRVHNSYIVNTRYIELWNTTHMKIKLKINTGIVETTDTTKLVVDPILKSQELSKEVPIGDKYLDIVKSTLNFLKPR